MLDEGTNEQPNPAVQAVKEIVFVVDTLRPWTVGPDDKQIRYGTSAGGRVMKRNFRRSREQIRYVEWDDF